MIYIVYIKTKTNTKQGNKDMKKYSLKWWFMTGKKFQEEGDAGNRIAKKLIPHLAYKAGYNLKKLNLI